MKFIHLTDPHMVANGELYGLDPAERLAACVADISARHADAAFVIVTGDLAHQGDEQAYRRLKTLLGGLTLPVHLLLGNHDNRAVFRAVFPEVPVEAGGFVQSSFATPAGTAVTLDTNDPAGHFGSLGRARLDWLQAQLDAAPERGVLLFMHHPPFAVGIPGMDRIALRDAGAFAEVLGDGRKIRHLFFGHLHRPLNGTWRGIPFTGLPGLNHQVALDLVRDGAVPGSHEPPAYGVVLVQPDNLLVHIHHFMDHTNTFDL